MRDKIEEFRISLPLVYLVQQTTQQTTPEILSYIKLLSEKIIVGASDKFRNSGTKELRGFWPDTKIYFRLRVCCRNNSTYINFEMPSQTKMITGATIDDCSIEEQLLDSVLPQFAKPIIKTPRGMKRMD
jgi:hypothetical protein